MDYGVLRLRPDKRRARVQGPVWVRASIRLALADVDRLGRVHIKQFPSHESTVPFVWDDAGTRYDMALAAGVTGVDFDDDTFLAARLGFAVVETVHP